MNMINGIHEESMALLMPIKSIKPSEKVARLGSSFEAKSGYDVIEKVKSFT